MDRLLRTSQAGGSAENYPENQITLAEGTAINIVRVEQGTRYKLKLFFSDGVERVIDFEPFLRRSRNPMIRAYLVPQKFANFRLEYGNLVWADYELCFPIADLYENNL
jgi:hypothetical protein